MSDESNTPPETGKREPTLAEVQALAEQASKTAMEAKTVAEAKTNVERDVKDKADAEGLKLSDEDAKKIADAFVTQLEAMGMFEDTEKGGGNAPVPPGNAAPADGASPQTTTAPPPSVPAPSATDTVPKKRTFAERFMGK